MDDRMRLPARDQLLFSVEHFLRVKHIAPTRFGRNAVGDPRFVFDLRNGRLPRPATVARVHAYMQGEQFPKLPRPRPWSRDDTARLITLIGAGHSYRDAAKALGRTPQAARKRAMNYADEHFPLRPPRQRVATLVRSITS